MPHLFSLADHRVFADNAFSETLPSLGGAFLSVGRSRHGGTVERWGAPELRPLIMSPGLDVGANSRERHIMPAPRRVSGGGPGGTPREGPTPRKGGVPGYLGGAKDRPAGLW